MINIGFTGTRMGWLRKQEAAVHDLLRDTYRDIGGQSVPLRFHGGHVTAHSGDCLGADAQFHSLATFVAWITVGHPPVESRLRAFLDYDEEREPLPYMQRNAAIVAAADLMLATPAEMTRQRRGGTWATIRMARKAGKPLVIVYPDGSMEGSWT